MNGVAETLNTLWYRYTCFAENQTADPTTQSVKNIGYWRGKLFSTFSTYLIPVSFIALIPGVWMAIYDRLFIVAIYDLAAAFLIVIVLFNNKLSLSFRKAFVMGVLYLLALFLIVMLGLFGPGMLYLLAITIFITLIFPVRIAYYSILLHVVSCISFAFLIRLKLFHSPLFNSYSTGTWIAFSSNLIFLSLVCMSLVDKIIKGLESTIRDERELQTNFQKQAEEKNVLNNQLGESEGHYRSLFFLNPSPMVVFDQENLKILQVNDTALKLYGYSEDEFSNIMMTDIRVENETDYLEYSAGTAVYSTYDLSTKHKGKNRQPFPVDIRYSMISFEGKKAVLCIINDITELQNHVQAIKKQNTKLKEIAYIQSHTVRAPLAKIMGLVDLIVNNSDGKPEPKLLHYLDKTANEFDVIIKTITHHTDNTEEAK